MVFFSLASLLISVNCARPCSSTLRVVRAETRLTVYRSVAVSILLVSATFGEKCYRKSKFDENSVESVPERKQKLLDIIVKIRY